MAAQSSAAGSGAPAASTRLSAADDRRVGAVAQGHRQPLDGVVARRQPLDAGPLDPAQPRLRTRRRLDQGRPQRGYVAPAERRPDVQQPDRPGARQLDPRPLLGAEHAVVGEEIGVGGDDRRVVVARQRPLQVRPGQRPQDGAHQGRLDRPELAQFSGEGEGRKGGAVIGGGGGDQRPPRFDPVGRGADGAPGLEVVRDAGLFGFLRRGDDLLVVAAGDRRGERCLRPFAEQVVDLDRQARGRAVSAQFRPEAEHSGRVAAGQGGLELVVLGQAAARRLDQRP